MQDSYHKLVNILTVVFTLLQLIIIYIFGYTPYPDSEGYIFIAKECIENNDIYPVATMLNSYEFLWNIGAINLVVFTLKIFNSLTPLLILYALMKGATAWLFYHIVKDTINHKIAIIAFILYIIYPSNYGESTSVLSELPFMFFIMLGLWLCISKKLYFLGGNSLALANWIRPMGIIFLIAIIIYLFYENRKNIMRPLLGYIAMILFIGSLSMFRTGLFLYQAKTGWMSLMDYSSNHSPESMEIREINEWNVSQKDSAWKDLFFDWLIDHPIEYIEKIPHKLVKTYISDNINMCTFIPDKAKKEYMYETVSMPVLMNNFPQYSVVQWFTLFNLFYYYGLLLTAIWSLVYYYRKWYLLPISIVVLGTLTLLLLGHGEARFHILFMPFIMMLSAQLIYKVYAKSKMD